MTASAAMDDSASSVSYVSEAPSSVSVSPAAVHPTPTDVSDADEDSCKPPRHFELHTFLPLPPVSPFHARAEHEHDHEHGSEPDNDGAAETPRLLTGWQADDKEEEKEEKEEVKEEKEEEEDEEKEEEEEEEEIVKEEEDWQKKKKGGSVCRDASRQRRSSTEEAARSLPPPLYDTADACAPLSSAWVVSMSNAVLHIVHAMDRADSVRKVSVEQTLRAEDGSLSRRIEVDLHCNSQKTIAVAPPAPYYY
jgi:hypothetical protein